MKETGNKNAVMLDKKAGETPLECLERFRADQVATGHAEFADMPMTYAGRLDPMASGQLLVLMGEECKKREKYLSLDKEYEVEILFGVETDSQDVLGLIKNVNALSAADIPKINFAKYVGTFNQPYPAYSSKTVDGKQLHAHAREGTLPEADEMPSREVKIYSITEIGQEIKTGEQIAAEALTRIAKVTGDFRQNEIVAGWKKFGLEPDSSYAKTKFDIIKIRVSCGSGTYMRSLAERIR